MGPGPKLLTSDEAAIPVLRELLDDPSPAIREIARIGLGIPPEYPQEMPVPDGGRAIKIVVIPISP